MPLTNFLAYVVASANYSIVPYEIIKLKYIVSHIIVVASQIGEWAVLLNGSEQKLPLGPWLTRRALAVLLPSLRVQTFILEKIELNEKKLL